LISFFLGKKHSIGAIVIGQKWKHQRKKKLHKSYVVHKHRSYQVRKQKDEHGYLLPQIEKNGGDD